MFIPSAVPAVVHRPVDRTTVTVQDASATIRDETLPR